MSFGHREIIHVPWAWVLLTVCIAIVTFVPFLVGLAKENGRLTLELTAAKQSTERRWPVLLKFGDTCRMVREEEIYPRLACASNELVYHCTDRKGWLTHAMCHPRIE